ncbi:MAG: hypothetical protein JST00_33990 [Deltaproteobacteria bacterium]|nr:hypothetical protein [Deltaproteobacteria bacterium]
MLELVAPPKWIGDTLRYRTRARQKRSFATVLDAAEVFPDGGTATVRFEKAGSNVALSVAMEMKNGHAEDRIEHDAEMRLRRLERHVTEPNEAKSRHEIIEFASPTHVIPACTYVDTSTPFVLSGQPFDGKQRSMYLWICDRFVARVYYESQDHHAKIDVPAGRIDTTEVLLYPDLNDWVKLPSIITKLSKPFLPKYHMWYERDAPHRLVRFEGPLGPPGAPEIVIELAAR